ncbi:unnamed protein product, partial [Phaeothamnion confervicola]
RAAAFRRARADFRNFLQHRVLPVALGCVTVHALGRLQPGRGAIWHSRRHLWPLGFKASRLQASPAQGGRVLQCTLEVLDAAQAEARGVGGFAEHDGPVFLLTLDRLGGDLTEFSGRDPYRPWLRAL